MNGALGRFGSFRRLYVDCIGTVAFHRCCRTQEFPKQSVSEHGLGGQPSASSRAIDGTLIHRRVTAMEAYPPPGLLSSSCTTQAGGWGGTLGGPSSAERRISPCPGAARTRHSIAGFLRDWLCEADVPLSHPARTSMDSIGIQLVINRGRVR